MKLTARRAATVSAALTLTMLGPAMPAQASSASALNDCPVSYACLWTLPNFTGMRWQSNINNASLPSWIQHPGSSYNNGVCTVHWYSGINYTGVRLNQQPGSAAANIGTILSMSWC